MCQLNQSNLLRTPFYVHKVQFIFSCVLHLPHMASFVNYFIYSRTDAHHSRLFVELAALFKLLFFSLITSSDFFFLIKNVTWDGFY